uniref:Uncharacterized protein n=1 Tax=Myoviridae sp. ct8ME27 TaxID=2826622 RepID=A0A8S5N6K1_9CAUD|nr:MAG TPA: hypothetical protein [Myoviridae sp. ct8ME27]
MYFLEMCSILCIVAPLNRCYNKQQNNIKEAYYA